MRAVDAVQLWLGALRGHRSRSLMLLLAVGIGVLAVVLLTGLGEGARAFVVQEFASLGRNTLIVLPGRNETTGGMPPITGLSPRELTAGDARAIARLPQVRRVAPQQAGQLQVSAGNRSREVLVLGTSRDFFAIRQLRVAQGQALPRLAYDEPEAVCVIGAGLRRELFGSAPALGQWLRAGDRRLRVIGILAPRGESFGMDFNEMLIMPLANAQALFNREGLLRAFVEIRGPRFLASSRAQILATLRARHGGEEDVTLVSQGSLLGAFDDILATLTLALAGVAAISLLVAGILVMNVTWISVSQRTAEIGLLKAIGATAGQVRLLFLGEAALLALGGALAGLLLGEALLWGARLLLQLPLYAPWWARLGALALALASALLFAWLPASRGAAMAPVAALQPLAGGH
ncbi:ABC transporter permease [Pseudomonas sp. MBLB4123]|uniref:ABC transporter permease n=1 Tax=Pseudomonas sp. MBLB4123 TaxID=3451557 RepID=UPI003F750247